MMRGERIASRRSVAAYGSQRSSHRRDGGSSRINTSVAAPTRPIEYFEIIPSPIHAPTAHQPLERFPINTLSSEYSAPAQQAVSGASGVIKKETEKKNGKTCMNSTATKPTDLLNKL